MMENEVTTRYSCVHLILTPKTHCDCLNELVCRNGGRCRFYITEEQEAASRFKSKVRLARLVSENKMKAERGKDGKMRYETWA